MEADDNDDTNGLHWRVCLSRQEYVAWAVGQYLPAPVDGVLEVVAAENASAASRESHRLTMNVSVASSWLSSSVVRRWPFNAATALRTSSNVSTNSSR